MKTLLALLLLLAGAVTHAQTNLVVTVRLNAGQYAALTNATASWNARNSPTNGGITFTPAQFVEHSATNLIRAADRTAANADYQLLNQKFFDLTPAQRRTLLDSLQ